MSVRVPSTNNVGVPWTPAWVAAALMDSSHGSCRRSVTHDRNASEAGAPLTCSASEMSCSLFHSRLVLANSPVKYDCPKPASAAHAKPLPAETEPASTKVSGKKRIAARPLC